MDDEKVLLLQQKLLKSLNKKKLMIIYNIVNRKEPCSLRLIEWFVSSYAKENRVEYKLNGSSFNVYNSYKDEQLTSFNKKLFDMYRRMKKIDVKIDDKLVLVTTVAQLNFFDWVFKNKVLDYISSNIYAIKNDLDSYKPSRKKKDKKYFDDVKVSRINITIIFE